MAACMIDKVFQTYERLSPPAFTKLVLRSVLAFTLLLILGLVFIPWQQTTQGDGKIISLDPNDRIQEINSLVSGRIFRWFVQDGSLVKKDDPIVEIVDNDPLFVNRLAKETEAKRKKFELAKSASTTANRDYERQRDLFERGLTSRKIYEKAYIDYQKLLSDMAAAEAELAKAENTLSRQEVRIIKAPTDGTILKVISGSQSLVIKEGESVATMMPLTHKLAAEVYISGNDLSLVKKGRKARLQFEGWPAIQFSGWPQSSVGTYGGTVEFIDPSTTKPGAFRVVIVPDALDHPWPDSSLLRQGMRVHAWILLDNVRLGYEIWRRFNGFPLASIAEKP